MLPTETAEDEPLSAASIRSAQASQASEPVTAESIRSFQASQANEAPLDAVTHYDAADEGDTPD